MKKHILFLFCILVGLVLLAGCPRELWDFSETRTMPIGTVIIGIAGEPSDTPYIEIIYSKADDDNPGHNRTASRMVSPPYIFQNDRVYMTYEYREFENKVGNRFHTKKLLRSFEEGGAEYFRIINHSPDKQVEFFLAGYLVEDIHGRFIPDIWYRNAPVYYLLQPERKPSENFYYLPAEIVVYFEGDRIGDLTVTDAWSIEEVTALYRAEYARSNEIRLTVWGIFRLIDVVDGLIESDWERGRGAVLYGFIKPGEELQGNENIWLLGTYPFTFSEIFEREPYR
jgi:hypothetical protein